MDGVHNKLVMQLSGDDFVTGLKYGLADTFIQNIGRHVGHSRSLFYFGQIIDKYWMQRPSGNVKIVPGP